MFSLKLFFNSDNAVTSIEYGLLGALIAVVTVASVKILGNEVMQLYAYLTNKIVLAMS